MSATPKHPDLPALVEQQQSQLAAGKAAYQLADTLGRRIARRVKGAKRRTVSFIAGTQFKLVNNTRLLRENGLLYGHGAVREWDVQPMTKAELVQQAEQAEKQSMVVGR